MRPYMLANFAPYVLTAAAEQKLKPKDRFSECSTDCPQMIVLPPGKFIMGSPEGETGRVANEGPQHPVTIARQFAVSIYDVTFDEWKACVNVRRLPRVADSGYDAGNTPITNVTWNDARLTSNGSPR